MNLKLGLTVKLKKLYTYLKQSRIFLEFQGSYQREPRWGDTQDKMTINKNDVNIILDSRKGKNESMMFYLKANIYSPKVSKPQEIKTNLI